MMKDKLIPFLRFFIPFSLLLFGIQFVLVDYIFETDLYYNTISIYGFHVIATFLIYVFLIYVHNTFRDKTGFAFMGCSLFKMLAAVLFLLPMMLSDTQNPFQDMIAFFVPYFLFLIFETIYAVRLINIK
ncbi:hypothetical protein [Christiangramia crocea]|uniref:ATP synthase protein I2 n=1 Tax=Christiangramia crocea TaxID=2904124 RepID=A0A9X2A7B7_9FLAO|nr:hypothetical protein [Gramella crocea]MCG9971387.1 hypothetical protein [Gramella crocea]